jgi:Tol biopolymer transport system component
VGGNPDHNFEVFGSDSATSNLTQLTTSSDCGNWGATVNADGTRIAFASSCDLTGGNADHNAEIFRLDTTTHTLTQVTSSQGCSGNSDPTISSDGARISFVSSCNLTGENPDGNHEIFRFEASNGLRQITDSTGCENFYAATSADGAHIAFVSTCNLTGGNADANYEIFRFDLAGGRLTQVTTSTGCGSMHPAISADGTHIVFDSSCDLTGTNPDGNWEIFRFDSATGTVTAMTTSSECMGNFVPAVSADASAAVFESYCNLTNQAPGGANDNLEIVLAQSRLRRARPISIGTRGLQGRSQRVRP